MLELKKGEKVILKGFTGIKLGVFPIESATKKTVTILKKNGDELVFDRKTGKQVNVEEGKEKYANSIIEDDGSFVAPSTVGAKRKSAKKATKVAPKVEVDDEVEEEDEEDEEEEPAPKKPAKKAKKPAKKSKKPEPEEDEDDEDDYDEFEEVDD